MKALVWDGSTATLRERDDPAAIDDMAIVRVNLAGVCNTDLEIVKGYMDFRGVLGHEFVGQVESGPAPWLGERVVGEINFACGTCPACGQGLRRHCPHRTVMGILDADGAFAQRVAVPVANLHRVPDGVDDRQAVFAEPLAAAFEILEQVDVEPEMDCVVLGDGKLGLLVAQVLHQAGACVLAVGRHAEKLALLADRGIETTLQSDWRRGKADLVVEATGTADGFRAAIEATRPRGTLVLKTTVAETPEIDLAPIVINEIHVVGSRCGPFPPALGALEQDRVVVEPLVEEIFPLARADEALRHASRRGAMKTLVDCS